MTSQIGKPYAGDMYRPDYELRETKRGFQVVVPQINDGKVRRFQSMSPIYRDRAAAEFSSRCAAGIGAAVLGILRCRAARSSCGP